MKTNLELSESQKKGAIYQSLSRNSKEIMADRGQVILEDLDMTFKRNVEDLERKLSRLVRSRNNMYDFSPTNTQSLVMAKDLDADNILVEDMKASIEIRQLSIELEVAKERYEFLFGQKI